MADLERSTPYKALKVSPAHKERPRWYKLSRPVFLTIPKNMNLIMGGFDGKNITVHLHVQPHTLIIDIPGQMLRDFRDNGVTPCLLSLSEMQGGAVTIGKWVWTSQLPVGDFRIIEYCRLSLLIHIFFKYIKLQHMVSWIFSFPSHRGNIIGENHSFKLW